MANNPNIGTTTLNIQPALVIGRGARLTRRALPVAI
jgi:hypothetical protein